MAQEAARAADARAANAESDLAEAANRHMQTVNQLRSERDSTRRDQAAIERRCQVRLGQAMLGRVVAAPCIKS